MPVGARRFSDALRMGSEVFHALRAVLRGRQRSTGVGDEGGFAPNLASDEEALAAIMEAIATAGYRAGTQVKIAIDAASSELWKEGLYVFRKSGAPSRSQAQMVDLYADWVERYPIVSIEDGMAENDWEGWGLLTARLGRKVQLVGDDLFVTNPDRLRQGIEAGAANSNTVKRDGSGISRCTASPARPNRARYSSAVRSRPEPVRMSISRSITLAKLGAGPSGTGISVTSTRAPGAIARRMLRRTSSSSSITRMRHMKNQYTGA